MRPEGRGEASATSQPGDDPPGGGRGSRRPPVSGRRIMTAEEIRRAVIRISHEIVEKHAGTDGLVLVGIQRRGVPIARRLAEAIRSTSRRPLPVGRARHHLLPRRPLDARPAAGRQGHGPAVRRHRHDRRPRRRRPLHRPDDPGRDGRPHGVRPAARRSAWRSSSTAATASCRSGPTTSARTCRPRARSSSGSGSRRSTARTPSTSIERPPTGGRSGTRRPPGDVTVVTDPALARRPSTPSPGRPRRAPPGWRRATTRRRPAAGRIATCSTSTS